MTEPAHDDSRKKAKKSKRSEKDAYQDFHLLLKGWFILVVFLSRGRLEAQQALPEGWFLAPVKGQRVPPKLLPPALPGLRLQRGQALQSPLRQLLFRYSRRFYQQRVGWSSRRFRAAIC